MTCIYKALQNERLQRKSLVHAVERFVCKVWSAPLHGNGELLVQNTAARMYLSAPVCVKSKLTGNLSLRSTWNNTEKQQCCES